MCNGRVHELIVITRESTRDNSEAVTRWCEKCGAIVVDLDVDGRTSPGYYVKMRFPKATRELAKQLNS